jgi:hypothetical protein
VSKIKHDFSEIFEPSLLPVQKYSHFKEYKTKKSAFVLRSKSVAIGAMTNVPSRVSLKSMFKSPSKKTLAEYCIERRYGTLQGSDVNAARPDSKDSLYDRNRVLKEKVSRIKQIAVAPQPVDLSS